VCDAFDAMTNPRPYRASVGIGTALEELRRGSGTQFDPGVIEPFCGMFENRIDRWAQGA
jgi:HD-GYP domain-containing protein (c-di-GMP phosphodiesterase class II)